MLKDAEIQPANNHNPSAPDSSTPHGRGALPDLLQYNCIKPNYSRAVSRAIEYSANDFALYQIANAQGNAVDATKYLSRSHNWRNHWNPAASSFNHTDFPVPRDATGSFLPQDSLSCDGCYWGDPYYEATPREYAFNAHHDMATLINYTGGPETFVNRLDILFTPNLNPNGSPQFNYTIFNPGNEHNFAGRQDLSVKRARYIAKSYYNPSPSGLPGNSDAGAMQIWLLWNMIGLYPLTGQTTFLIHSPWFSINIDLESGKSLDITTEGGDSDAAFRVQILRVNGQVWGKSWVT